MEKAAWNLFLDLIYPPRCGGCDKRGTLLCDDCRGSITLPGESDLAVPELDLLLYAGSFEGRLRQAIHNFKYENDTPLAKPLAGLLSDALSKHLSTTWQGDDLPVLVPVPLHSSRRKERGYNQAELLARQLSRETSLPIDHRLVRVRETRSQVGLRPDERKANVAGAFEWQRDTAPPAVVLVDDVCTTGATLAECAGVLRLKGTRRVYAVIIARAMGMSLAK